MAATSWKGAPFFIDKYEIAESAAEKEAKTLRATRKVASSVVLASSALFILAMLESSSWLTSRSHDDIVAHLGPSGIYMNNHRLSFFSCPAPFELKEGTISWMQFYGVCASGPDSPSLWWWTVLFGWLAALLTCVGPILGMLSRILIRVEAMMVMVGEMCALSALICFLNWNYASDLLFEQALVFTIDPVDHISLAGPVNMKLHWPLLVFVTGFFSCFFAVISLMVVSRSGLRDAVIQGNE